MRRLVVFIMACMVSFLGISQIPIAEIQANYSLYNGQYVWIEGVITIGAGRLYNVAGTPYLKAYIMDDSGKGLQIFDYALTPYITQLIRGNKVLMFGQITEYQNNLEILPTSYSVVGTGFNLDQYTIQMSIVQALNWQENEGTFIETTGKVLSVSPPNEIGYEVIMEDEITGLDIRIWNYFTNGILPEWWQIQSIVKVKGALGVFNSQANIYPGYPEDVNIQITGLQNRGASEPGCFTLYPNPVKDRAMILIKDDCIIRPTRIEVLDISGRITCIDYTIQDFGIEIFCGHLRPGLYFIKMSSHMDIYIKVFIN
mgnify:CR=1 FL=1